MIHYSPPVATYLNQSVPVAAASSASPAGSGFVGCFPCAGADFLRFDVWCSALGVDGLNTIDGVDARPVTEPTGINLQPVLNAVTALPALAAVTIPVSTDNGLTLFNSFLIYSNTASLPYIGIYLYMNIALSLTAQGTSATLTTMGIRCYHGFIDQGARG